MWNTVLGIEREGGLMDRLTNCIEGVVYYSKGTYPPATICAEMETHEIRRCMRKLAAYEDSGLEPREVKELEIRMEALADTVNMLSPLIMESHELKEQVQQLREQLCESRDRPLNSFELAGYDKVEADELTQLCRRKGIDEECLAKALSPYVVAPKMEGILRKLKEAGSNANFKPKV